MWLKLAKIDQKWIFSTFYEPSIWAASWNFTHLKTLFYAKIYFLNPQIFQQTIASVFFPELSTLPITVSNRTLDFTLFSWAAAFNTS
jgi:hypothetical protein